MGGPVDRTPALQPAAGVYTHDVFLSYTHDVKDDVARPLAEGLEKKGVSVWWNHSAVEIGDSLPQKIREGLDGARYGVVIVSRGYLDSGWGRTELGAMFGSGRVVFPVLYGVSAEAAKKRLPSISEAYMQVWKDPPAPIIRKIADKVNKSRGEGKVGRAADAAGGGDWKAPLDASSRGSVTATPRAINGKTIPRTSEALGIERLLAEHGRVAVVGDRGSGKSALMCQVHGRLEKSTTAVFVKADDFLGVESADELDGRIVPGHSFVRLVGRAASAKGGAVVIIDSLDSMARDRKAMAAFKHLIKEVWGAGVGTIVTVRSYDYRHSALIASTDWGAEYDLDALSAGQVSEALARMGGPRVPDELMPLLASPLNLYLLSRISGPGGGRADLSKIGGELDLYDAHWHRHVEQDAMPGRVRDALYGAARRMVEAGRTAIPRSLLDRDAEAADQALRAGVLRRVPGTDRVAFFHHAYLDYVASRAMLEDGPGVVGLLGSNEYNMFVRPTLPLTFMMAYKRGPREFAGLAAKVLGSGLKHYWKMTAASALARIRGGSAGDYVRLGRLLTGESMLQRHFLSEAASERNGFWLGAWGGSFLEAWASDKANPNGEFLAAYARAAVSAAAPADPGSRALAFTLLRLVAENSQSGAARERAVRLMAGVDAPGRAAWLESASGSGDARARAGVAHALPDLVHTDPGSVPAIFARLFAYEETTGGRADPAGGPVRDNAMIKWKLEKEFPGMLKERPDVMIKSAMLAVERIYAAADPPSLPDAGRLIDAGPGAMLRALLPRHSRSVVVPAVRAYLKACDDGEFDALAPLLAGSRLGVFRSMLVDGMAGRGDDYLAGLVDELADPHAYELHSMRASVRGAIGRIAGRLEGGQLSRILEAIMESNRPGISPGPTIRHKGRLRAQLHADMPAGMPAPGEENRVLAALGLQPPPGDTEESARLRGDLARAEFLAEFPEEMLNNDQLELVKARRQRAAASAPPPPPEASPSRGMLAPATARRPRKESITDMIGKRLDLEGRIALLESISEYLDDPGGEPDGALLDRIEGCLLESAKHPDPDCGAAEDPDTLAVDNPSVRGLAALCLARMVTLRRGGEAEDALRALSKDPSGVVRAGVARGLARLLPSRYDLAYPILLEYSRDPDARIRLFLGDRFDVVMNRDPAQASAVVQNVLAAGGPPMHGTVDSLLWLALKKRDTRAASLLDRVVGGGSGGSGGSGGPRDIRAEIPFALQPYLSSRDHRDAALGLLYRLIEAGPEDVRSNAAFFTFNGPEGGDGDAAGRDHARRVAPHIGLLASLFDGGQFDLQTAEHAMQFLETRWSAAPGTALSCLEAVARNGADPARQPVLAPCTASIISGMIELYMPGDGEWERCLDVLDVYAAAGWPEILELLASMERPD